MPLSAPDGPYLVSTLDIEVPVRQPRSYSSAYFRVPSSDPKGKSAATKPALQLKTVLFTIYYPYAVSPDASGGAGGQGISSTAHTAGNTSGKKIKVGQVSWLGTSRLKLIEGLLKYAGMPKYLALPAILPAYAAFFAKIPLARDQPLLSPPSSSSNSLPSDTTASAPPPTSALPAWPTAVFSHGLGGTRMTYSQYLSNLASHGMIVAAVEHRDRSGPYTAVTEMLDESKYENGRADADASGETAATSAANHGRQGKPPKLSEEGIFYMAFEELEAASDPSNVAETDDEPEESLASGTWKRDKWAWRRAQLALRRAEVLEVHSVLRAITRGDGASLLSRSAPFLRSGEGSGATLPDWKGRLSVDGDKDAMLIAHSFGGATAIDLAMRAEEETSPRANGDITQSSGAGSCPFGKLVVLDPWLEPLQKENGGSVGRALPRPIYVINSEVFSVWVSHMELLRSIVQKTKEKNQGQSWLMTLSGTKHTDFSDFPFLLARMFSSSVNPLRAVRFFGEWTRHALGLRSAASSDGQAAAAAVGEDAERVEIRYEKPGEVKARDLGQPKGVGIWNVPSSSQEQEARL